MSLSHIFYPISHNARGQAIFPLVLTLSVLLGLIGVTLAGTGYVQSFLAGQRAFSEQARQAAQSGVEDALLRIARDRNWPSVLPSTYTLSVGSNVATVTVTDSSIGGAAPAPPPIDLDTGGGWGEYDGDDTHASALDPTTGHVWTSFFRGHDNNGGECNNSDALRECSLQVAEYIGSGGDCFSAAWDCTTVDSISNLTGRQTSIGITTTGIVWVSYVEWTTFNPINSADLSNNTLLKVATNGGAFGGAFGACTAAGWTCGVVDDDDEAYSTALAINPLTQWPWVSYYTSQYPLPSCGPGGCRVKVANFRNLAAGNCDTTGGSDYWDCAVIDINTVRGDFTGTALAFDRATPPKPWVLFQEAGSLSAAWFDGDGAVSDCANVAWTCENIHGIISMRFPSIAFSDPAITGGVSHSWVAYWNESAGDLYVASKTGWPSALPCPGTTAGWRCGVVENTVAGRTGLTPDIALHPVTQQPWVVSFQDLTTPEVVRLAVFVGDGNQSGQCEGGGNDWRCRILDNIEPGWSTGYEPTIVFDTLSPPNTWVIYGANSASNAETRWRQCSDTDCTEYTSSSARTRRTIEATSTVRNIQRKLRVAVEVFGSGGVKMISREELTF